MSWLNSFTSLANVLKIGLDGRPGAGRWPAAGINLKSGAKSGQGLGGHWDGLGGLGGRLSGLGSPGISVCSVFKNADQVHSCLSGFLVHGLGKTKG
ncbi:hypothetical protein ACFXTO_014477 [Malus domestica]